MFAPNEWIGQGNAIVYAVHINLICGRCTQLIYNTGMTESLTPTETPLPGTSKRATYRHGDLRRALLEAALQHARREGPHAVTLRALAREIGVAPNAAYRHFTDRDDLLQAVSWAAQAACAKAIEQELTVALQGKTGIAAAHAQLRSVGIGYLRFAQQEPGLFRAAFTVPADLLNAANPASAGSSGLTPFQLLGQALDALVEAGAMSAERRPYAEFLAWSSVHGLAMLVLDGPLRSLSAKQVTAIGERLVAMVERGL